MPSSASADIYSLSLHDALPILSACGAPGAHAADAEVQEDARPGDGRAADGDRRPPADASWKVARAVQARRASSALARGSRRHEPRSEEHTSELQSPDHLVCRLLRPPTSTLFPYTTLFRSCQRVGHRGRMLQMLKFRKMHDQATGARLTAIGDHRLTRVGRWLARFKLDELPQLWHVVRGDMSLDRKSTRLNSSHQIISYAVFCVRRHLLSFPTRRSSDLVSVWGTGGACCRC